MRVKCGVTCLKIRADGISDPGGDGVRRLQVQVSLTLLVQVNQVKQPRLGEIISQFNFRLLDGVIGFEGEFTGACCLFESRAVQSVSDQEICLERSTLKLPFIFGTNGAK